jgi:uncharacterized delta-60 repeat protein
MTKTLLTFLTLCLLVTNTIAQSSSLDLTFNPGTGANGIIWTTAIQSDGKIIIGGEFTSYNGTARNHIARINADGSLDASFNPGTGANERVRTIAIQSDGKIIIGGFFTSYNGTASNYITRLNADGSLDATFNPGTGANNFVNTSDIQSDGKIIIGGDFISYNGTTRNRIARLNADGSLDASFNSEAGTNSTVWTTAIQSDGKIIIGGQFTSYFVTARNRIARLNADGSIDASFNPGTGTNWTVYSTAIQSDGKIIIGGFFASYNGTAINHIARINADGSLDASFNPGTGVNGNVWTTAIQSDGKIIIGGQFTSYYGTTRNRIAILNTDGSLDVSFNPGTGANDPILTSSIQSDGKIIIGGGFTSYNGTTRNRIARIINCTPTTATDVILACNSYTWIDNITYTTNNNTATYVLSNAAGCDSTVTLNLTINPIQDKTISATPTEICDNGSSIITVNNSEVGVHYVLRDDSDNSVVAGPLFGTKSDISFNTGTISNTTSYNVFADRQNSGALAFTGNTGLKKVSLGTSLWNTEFAGGTQLTVEAWVNRSTTGSLQTIMSNYQGSFPMLFRIDNDFIRLYVNSGTNVSSTSYIPVGTWTHVAATYDGTNLKIFVNGVEENSVAYSVALASSTNEMKIGGGLTNNTEFFPGNIGEVRLWNVARTSAEISDSYNQQLVGNENGLVGYYKFSEGSGTTTYNSSTNGLYDGTLINSPAWVSGPVIISSNCSDEMTQTVTITVTNSPTSSVSSQTNVSCNGGSNGSATISAIGGSAPYTYSWSPTGGTDATATGLAANAYSVTITDAQGCTHVQPLVITHPTAITSSVSSQTNVSCNGGSNGSATISAIGGSAPYTYSWSPTGGTDATATGLAANAYTVTITDAQGCTHVQPLVITHPTAITSSVSSQTNVSCNGGSNGSATISATGGSAPYTYSWSPTGGTDATATGLAANAYTVTITDAQGCTHVQPLVITHPTAITSSVSSQTNVSCNGGSNGSATISATGGSAPYTYSWSPTGGTDATATGLAANAYTVTITDAQGCTHVQPLVITHPTAITSSVSSQTNVSCNGGSNGSATISATGGSAPYTYSWSPTGGTDATATGLAANAYTVTITDAQGCTHVQPLVITHPTEITSSVSSQTNVSCNGGSNGSATISAIGGSAPYTYSWSPTGGTDATATGLAANAYTVTIEDANGCTHTQSVIITEPTSITSSITSQTNVSCFGGSNGSANVTATGGTGSYTYSWSPSGGTIETATNLSAGTYTLTIEDANGCSYPQTVVIIEPNAITNSQTFIECVGFSVTIGSNTYNSTGVYTDVLTAANGCDSTVTTNLTIKQPTTGSQTFVECAGFSVTVGTNTYTTTGIYTDVLTNAAGCDSTVTTNLTITTIDNTTSLVNETITANISGASYQWLDCDNSNSPISGATGQSFTATSNGNYAVEITENGCTSTSSCVAVLSVGMLENSALSSISIYPNPNTGRITLITEYFYKNYTITDNLGKVVTQGIINNSQTDIDLSNNANGIYLLTIEGQVFKLVKQ